MRVMIPTTFTCAVYTIVFLLVLEKGGYCDGHEAMAAESVCVDYARCTQDPFAVHINWKRKSVYPH